MPRGKTIDETATHRTVEILDAEGEVIGTLEEPLEELPPPPFSPVEQLATLLAVNGTIDQAEAANLTGRTEDEIAAEAQAWAAAAADPSPQPPTTETPP